MIGFDECLYEREWSSAEIDALVMATDTLGAAIGREWIDAELRTRAHHLELLNKITDAAIAAPNLAQMLQTIADRLGKLLNADGCYITRWDETRQRVQHGMAYGELREAYLDEPAEPGITMTESVLRAGHALAADDVFNSPYVNPHEAIKYPTRSLLGLPLIARGKKLGAALIGFNHLHHFTSDEMERGEQAARHIALAIAKAQALEAEQQRAAELQAVHSAGLSLAASLDLATVLESILQSTFRFSPDAKDAHVFLYRDERLQFAASLWSNGRKDHQFAEPRVNGLTYTVARRGETAVISDMKTHPLFADAPHLQDGAIIGLPLKIGARIVGVMNVAYQDPRAFSKEELRVLELLASQAAIAVENARLFDETKQRAERMSALNEIGQALTATLKFGQLYRLIYQQARRVLTADCFYIAIYDEHHNTIHFPFMYDDGVELPNQVQPLGDGPSSRVIRTRASHLANRSSDPIFQGGAHFGTLSKVAASAIFVPMMLGPRVLGVISAQSYREGSYQPEDVQVLETIAAQAAIALENARLYDEVRQLAVTDEVTGLFNRRGLFQLGQREIERAIRYQRPLAAIMLDIDHFKQINDTYGHPAGDRVLRALAGCCRESIRTLDIAGRYGGEEFFLLLPETDLASALVIAERLRHSVEETNVESGHSQIRFTISLGVTTMAPDISNLATLIERADQAQYLAKQTGRNRVQKYA
ncbi:MAG: sensor domain-containing diguanylate cyclase [Chloroflexi bacterium]|nr:sensor domain-containing diguanylate cyclase [Chloroflexota bacterium]